MAPDVVDADVLKCNVVHLLLKYPQGIKLGDFSGAFYKLHGHHPQLALHGYSSLSCLLTDMKNTVVLEKNSQETVIKLASGQLKKPVSPFYKWLEEGEGWYSFEEVQSLTNEEAEDEADPCGPAVSLDRDFSAWNPAPQKMRGNASVMTAAVVPILGILQDYPRGLNLPTLTESLKKRGFDLELFSQNMGYGDTIYCLLDMPGLHLIFLNGMEPQNCVVQLLSSSPGLPALPLNTGSSLPKPLSSNATGTFSQRLMKTKPGNLPAPKQVLALLTNLLNTYPMGLQVKKLQEFLLATKGFDLEKFSIAQGYKDTLEFLEHKMPGLKIKYHGSRHKCVVKRGTRKKQKKSPGCQEKMAKCPDVKGAPPLPNVQAQVKPTKTVKPPGAAPAPAEVLALLTNILNNKTYKSGLRVKTLEELLLTTEGIDLEKFSLAQGYKDTLGFLEHQIPGLEITYSTNRLKCRVKQGLDAQVNSHLPDIQPLAESTKKVEPPNAAPDFGGIAKPVFGGATKGGPGASALPQNTLRSSIPGPSAITPSHPSSKEQGGPSPGKAKSSSQPRSGIPAQQPSACQFSGRSAAGELSHPTYAQVLSKSGPTKPSHSEQLDELKQQVAHILARHPEGMSLFQFRAAYSTTYQHHLPLGNASSAKQRLVEMSDIVLMKGYGVQTLLLPASREEPPTKSGPPVCSGVENPAAVLTDSLAKAVARPEPTVVSKPSLLKAPVEPQPHATHPQASSLLRAPYVKENSVLPKGQSPTTPKVVTPSQEAVRPKISLGGHPDSSKVEVAAKNLRHSSTEAAVKIEPVVVPKPSVKPSLSKTASVSGPQLRASVPLTSACLNENSFLPESLPPRPPEPSVPVGLDVTAGATTGENLFIPHFPVVFPEEPQVSRLDGIWTSDSFVSRPTYLAHPSFSVNIPVPSLFQPVLTNILAVSQPVVYPPLGHLPDPPADPSLGLAPSQLQKARLGNSHLTQPPSQNRSVRPTSPIRCIEQTDSARTADGLDQLQSASRIQGQGRSQAPGFSADGQPVSSPSVNPPSLQPFKSPSVEQPENVHDTWLSSIPHSSVPAAEDSVVASPSARVQSKPVEPARQKQYDAVNGPVTSPRTPPSLASHQPASSPFMNCTESAPVSSEPLGSMPQPHHIHANSARASSSAQPSTSLHSSPGSPTRTASQPSYVSFSPNTGHDASRQSQPLPGISREDTGQDSRHFTLPDHQSDRLGEESAEQPSALQNSPPPQSSDKCVIL